MFETKKLRPNTNVTGLVQPIVALLIIAICWGLYGMTAGMISMAFIFGFYATLSLAYFFRTGNGWFIVTMVYQLTILFYAMVAPKIGPYAISKEEFMPLVLIVVLEIAVLAYIIATNKLRWRGREILELAARNINEATNGFTERPRPLGKIDFRQSELKGFTTYLKSKLIAFTYGETDKTVIVPIMMGNEYRLPLGLSNDYSENTWVVIDKGGNVSAHISKMDYLKYKDALSFDQLCESLGNLFIEFFDYYQKGEEVRIQHEINRIKTNPFS